MSKVRTSRDEALLLDDALPRDDALLHKRNNENNTEKTFIKRPI